MVSDAGSIHTKRWVSSLVAKGVDVALFSITPVSDDFYEKTSCRCYSMDLFDYKGKTFGAVRGLLGHFDAVRFLKRVISLEKPDILHAHYATSYALVAALTGFHPFIVSVWGSDVYEFPYKSRTNAFAVRYILSRADKVLSTSSRMAVQTSLFYDGDIEITPFGVDTDLFCRAKKTPSAVSGKSSDDTFVFGTVKTLSGKYGIDILLRAFARLQEMLSGDERRTRLEISGKGKDREKLESMAAELGIADKVVFRGFVPHEMLPEVFSRLDVAVFLSREESFGVAAVEAMSCSCPVVVSDADGFTEVVENGVSGLIVPREDYDAAARAMLRLMNDSKLRENLGNNARLRVEKYYRWEDNVMTMKNIYEKVIRES